MKIISNDSYQCEICGHMYPKQELADECEESHLTISKVKRAIKVTEETLKIMQRKKECFSSETRETAKISIIAMNKMIPKRPNLWLPKGWCCPVCDCKIDKWESVIIYCSECGQAIGNED